MTEIIAPEPTHPPVSESGENQPLPEGYVCPEGYVPGWLNGDGLPTSCVSNDPMVELAPDLTPEVVVPATPYAPRELAATGSDAGVVAILVFVAALLFAIGFTLWKLRK